MLMLEAELALQRLQLVQYNNAPSHSNCTCHVHRASKTEQACCECVSLRFVDVYTQYSLLLVESVCAPETSSEGLQVAAGLLQASCLPQWELEAMFHCHQLYQTLMLTHCLSQQNAHALVHQMLVELWVES